VECAFSSQVDYFLIAPQPEAIAITSYRRTGTNRPDLDNFRLSTKIGSYPPTED
jgi:hypothetical protein